MNLGAGGKAWGWLPSHSGSGAPGSTLLLPTSSVFNSHVSLLPCNLWGRPWFNIPLCYIILFVTKGALRIIRTAFSLRGSCVTLMTCAHGYENIGTALLALSRTLSSLNSAPLPPCCLWRLDSEESEFMVHLLSLSADTALSIHPSFPLPDLPLISQCSYR